MPARSTLTEAQFQAQVLKAARLHGWSAAHFRRVRVQRKNGSIYYETPVAGDGAGWPDLLLAKGGVLLAAELKVGRNKMAAEQEQWFARLRAARVPCLLWYPKDWSNIVRVLSGEVTIEVPQ